MMTDVRKEEIMTDYQFKSILRMVLNIIESSEDLDKAADKVKELISGEDIAHVEKQVEQE
jgi:hypothetical protein